MKNFFRRLIEQTDERPDVEYVPVDVDAAYNAVAGGGSPAAFWEAVGYAADAHRVPDRVVHARGVRIEYTNEQLDPPDRVDPTQN